MAPTTVVEHDAYAVQAVLCPLVDGSVVKVGHVPQVQVVEKTFEIPQLQTMRKSSIFLKFRRSKQFFMNLMRRSGTVMILRRDATWLV